jgi:membrane protein implicated in regulation of membrane protease activity
MIRYSSDPLSHHEQDFTSEGEVIKVIRSGVWRVRYRGSYWTARSTYALSLKPGDWVRVIGVENISLWIEPL